MVGEAKRPVEPDRVAVWLGDHYQGAGGEAVEPVPSGGVNQ
jgi:hypothetical protein